MRRFVITTAIGVALAPPMRKLLVVVATPRDEWVWVCDRWLDSCQRGVWTEGRRAWMTVNAASTVVTPWRLY